MPANREYKEGEILTYKVQGLTYNSPPLPKLKTIRNYNKPIEDQIWERDTTYEKWDWNVDKKLGPLWYDAPAKGQMAWYEGMLEKLLVGEWVMINGTPTYFNRWCSFFFQWFLLQEGYYADYRDTCLEFYRFWEICSKGFALGAIGIKGRRLGLSSMGAAIQLLNAIIENNTIQGIVSKTGTDAEEMYIMVRNALENLPAFLMPDMRTIGKEEMHFATPLTKISKNNSAPQIKKGLNNRVNWLATAENAYDGRRLKFLIIDEAAKWLRANVVKMFSKVKETLVKGSSVIGKVLMMSTVNAGEQGGDNFKQLWDDSDPINGVDKYGNTKSRLLRFFIEGYRGVEGYIDKYGNSVIDTPTHEQQRFLMHVVSKETGELACQDPTIGAKEFRLNERKKFAKDPEGLQEEIRKYPFEWKEVFRGANNKCHFIADEVNDQIERVESKMELYPKLFRTGWFKRDNNDFPMFYDDPDGLWSFLELLPLNQANKSVMKHGGRAPNNTDYGASGLDTYNNSEATAEKGSDACLMIHKRYNALDPENSGMPIGMFLGRMKRKGDFHDQIFMGLEYFGIKMLAERAPTDWYDYAEKYNLLNYCVTTDLKTTGLKRFGIAPQDTQAREQHLTEMVEYCINNLEKVWFLPLLKQLIPFNVKDRTLYDCPMGWGYSLIALKEGYRNLIPEEPKESYVKTYQLGRKSA